MVEMSQSTGRTAYDIDSPERIDNFLSGLFPASNGVNQTKNLSDVAEDEGYHMQSTSQAVSDNSENNHNHNQSAPVAALPDCGVQISPPEPLSTEQIAGDKTGHRTPIDEDQSQALLSVADQSNLGLEHSIHADRRTKLRHSFNKLDLDEPNGSGLTSVQIELLRQRDQLSSEPASYHDRVVAKFKSDVQDARKFDKARSSDTTEAEAPERHGSGTQSAEPHPIIKPYQENYTPVSEQPKSSSTVELPSSTVTTPSFSSSPLVAPNMTVSMTRLAVSPSDVQTMNQKKSAAIDAPEDADDLRQASEVLTHKIAEVTLIPKEQKKTVNVGAVQTAEAPTENRKNAVYFAAWGSPAVRNKPTSHTRTIILSGLPLTTDFTLVQSLIHGGAIDTMRLAPSNTSAYVTFTDHKACDGYFNKYPNGLVFKLQGKTRSVFVDKSNEVDVISGMLEGYLGAGASRAVRASAVEEDWSMRALHDIATGNKAQRKVESIIDSYRGESRTIIFRFASIADAVMFRNSLLRDTDWEHSDIQFITDPCEKATGIHLE